VHINQYKREFVRLTDVGELHDPCTGILFWADGGISCEILNIDMTMIRWTRWCEG